MAGLRAARARGRAGGRRRVMTAEKVKMASRLMQDASVSVDEICRTLQVSRATLYRYVGPKGEVRNEL
jgi:DNA invertase Pin-like site-specific DNA recombinase